MKLRHMEKEDWSAVADLICVSTNYWYQVNRGFPIFPNGPESARVFCEVYETLDPGCCILAEHESGQLMGSCFYHPRPTHVSLGIMNVHPNYFGHGVARQLLTFIQDYAKKENKPVRLVSSAMNLDSFSLYTKAGFVPRQMYQDMILDVPEEGLDFDVAGKDQVREAKIEDVSAIVDLEMAVSGLDRTKDFEYFITNEAGIWHTSVYESDRGIDGVLVSVAHPGSNMLGPGIMRSEEIAPALILAELNANCGRSPVFLVPVDCAQLVQTMYQWGAKNCETHVAQVDGAFQPFDGVVMPTFMPETG